MFWCLKKYKNKCIEFNRLLFLSRNNAAPLCPQCNGRKMKHKENIYIRQRTSNSHFVTANGTVHVHKRYVQNIREPPLGNPGLPTSHWIFVATRTRATQYTLDQMLQWIYYLIGTLPLPLSLRLQSLFHCTNLFCVFEKSPDTSSGTSVARRRRKNLAQVLVSETQEDFQAKAIIKCGEAAPSKGSATVASP